MRRRTLLTAAAAGAAMTALPGLAACWPGRSTRSRRPAPTPPPTPDAAPSAFAERPTWPDVAANMTLTAARDHYLCAGTTASEASKTFTGGWCPVIVDVSTLTTRTVLLDKNGTWTTAEAELVSRYAIGKDPKSALTTIVIGPALLDEEHAYLVVDTIALSEPDPESNVDPHDFQSGETCSVSALKVRLSDGAIAASVPLNERFFAKNVTRMSLSFSTDRTALLLAGSNSTNDDNVDADFVALRLSAEDLSVQFDAHSILEGKRTRSVLTYGQAISASGRTTIFLADGAQKDTPGLPIMMKDDWFYYEEHSYSTGSPASPASPDRGYAWNRATDQTVELDENGADEVRLAHWPAIASDQPEIISVQERDNDTDFTVRPPGAASPALRWTPAERPLPQGAGILGDIVYTTYYPDESDDRTTQRLELTSVSTGETILETDQKTSIPGMSVVTPWGLACRDGFYAATAWLDS